MTAAAPPAFDVVVKKKHPQKTKNKQQQQQQTLLDYKSQRAERRRERLRQLWYNYISQGPPRGRAFPTAQVRKRLFPAWVSVSAGRCWA